MVKRVRKKISKSYEQGITSPDYETVYKKFSWKVPKYFNWAFDVVDKLAERKISWR